jgi:hypothetical protein
MHAALTSLTKQQNERAQRARSPATYHFLPVFAGAFLAGAFEAACGRESDFAVAGFRAEDAGGVGAFGAAAFGAGFLSDVWVSAEALTVLISRGVRDFGALSPFDAIVAVFGVVFSVLTISGSPLKSQVDR